MRERFKLWEPIAVRWSDMDAMGHVNNAKYFTYFEAVRIRYFEAIHLWHLGDNPKDGPALVSATCNFRKQVHFPADLEIGATVSRIGTKSFTFDHVVLVKGTEDVVADGQTTAAWVNYETGTAIPVPDRLRAAFEAFEGRS